MSQKILAAHGDGVEQSAQLIEVRVDQVVLAREPNRVLRAAVDAGLVQCTPEVNLAYPPHCVGLDADDRDPHGPHRVPKDALSLGFSVARPGAGFAAAVHLERFASPAKLLLSDEPRLATCGAVGCLTLPASRGQLIDALIRGHSSIRAPRSLHILISGRLRPFISARDASLDLIRRGLRAAVRKIDSKYQAPVILEFGGPGAKHLSIPDRATLCGLSPEVGAAGALFGSDERTELYLREQRRSKAHRNLAADTGAPWEEILPLDLAAVEPLAMNEKGEVRPIRELAGMRVTQVLLGGDSGTSLRDWLSTAALLKSKRVAPGVEFLMCPASRQTLEVLARGPALPDLIATGGRLLEPDRRVVSGLLYSSTNEGLSLRSSDFQSSMRGLIASAETLAFAVAHGSLGDPRGFRRPVRVTVPRSLPTDDVLIMRGFNTRASSRGKELLNNPRECGDLPPPDSERFGAPYHRHSWKEHASLAITSVRQELLAQTEGDSPKAFLATNLEEVRWIVENAAANPALKVVLASHIPAATVSILSGLGIFALQTEPSTVKFLLKTKRLTLPERKYWDLDRLSISVDSQSLDVRWLAQGAERGWASDA